MHMEVLFFIPEEQPVVSYRGHKIFCPYIKLNTSTSPSGPRTLIIDHFLSLYANVYWLPLTIYAQPGPAEND